MISADQSCHRINQGRDVISPAHVFHCSNYDRLSGALVVAHQVSAAKLSKSRHVCVPTVPSTPESRQVKSSGRITEALGVRASSLR